MWSYITRIGTFFIEQRADRFHVVFDGESLGGYTGPEQAAASVAGGHTFSAGAGIDTSLLGIPEDLSEWKCNRPLK